jgi:hypothetical protein
MWTGNERFDLGMIGDVGLVSRQMPAPGRWSCELGDGSLNWSDPVFALFGFPRDSRPARADTLARYHESSRAAMERLRAHAIRHRRGFTLDVEISPVDAGDRWMRLMAMPVCEGGKVVRLHGLKQDVTALYR